MLYRGWRALKLPLLCRRSGFKEIEGENLRQFEQQDMDRSGVVTDLATMEVMPFMMSYLRLVEVKVCCATGGINRCHVHRYDQGDVDDEIEPKQHC